ncbi:MAG: hypothetical protein ACFFB3_04435 [Candidatus Hodarchaeota archaeon]
MTRLRLFGIELAIAMSLVALAPNQLIAFDGSKNLADKKKLFHYNAKRREG